MSTESTTFDVPHVHILENGIVVTIEPKYCNMSTLILFGPWYKFLVIGHTMTDDVTVQGWEGPFGFNHRGELDTDKKTLTCTVFHREIERDLSSLSTLLMIRPDFE